MPCGTVSCSVRRSTSLLSLTTLRLRPEALLSTEASRLSRPADDGGVSAELARLEDESSEGRGEAAAGLARLDLVALGEAR